MNQLSKAQITIGLLACFAMAWGLFQQALNSTDIIFGFFIAIIQIVFIIILAVIILGLLEWIKIFDLKANAIITLIVVIAIRLTSVKAV